MGPKSKPQIHRYCITSIMTADIGIKYLLQLHLGCQYNPHYTLNSRGLMDIRTQSFLLRLSASET